MSEPFISIWDVARASGLELSKEDATRVGMAVRERWKGLNKTLPEKDLRRKAWSNGSNCLAVYPPDWFGVISEEIGKVRAEQARQLSLPI